jgi:hypothetical protein
MPAASLAHQARHRAAACTPRQRCDPGSQRLRRTLLAPPDVYEQDHDSIEQCSYYNVPFLLIYPNRLN